MRNTELAQVYRNSDSFPNKNRPEQAAHYQNLRRIYGDKLNSIHYDAIISYLPQRVDWQLGAWNEVKRLCGERLISNFSAFWGESILGNYGRTVQSKLLNKNVKLGRIGNAILVVLTMPVAIIYGILMFSKLACMILYDIVMAVFSPDAAYRFAVEGYFADNLNPVSNKFANPDNIDYTSNFEREAGANLAPNAFYKIINGEAHKEYGNLRVVADYLVLSERKRVFDAVWRNRFSFIPNFVVDIFDNILKLVKNDVLRLQPQTVNGVVERAYGVKMGLLDVMKDNAPLDFIQEVAKQNIIYFMLSSKVNVPSQSDSSGVELKSMASICCEAERKDICCLSNHADIFIKQGVMAYQEYLESLGIRGFSAGHIVDFLNDGKRDLFSTANDFNSLVEFRQLRSL